MVFVIKISYYNYLGMKIEKNIEIIIQKIPHKNTQKYFNLENYKDFYNEFKFNETNVNWDILNLMNQIISKFKYFIFVLLLIIIYFFAINII